MTNYQVVYVLTHIMFAYSIYVLLHCFFNDVKDVRIERLSYILYYILSSIIFFISRMPIVNLILSVLSVIILSINYRSGLYRRLLVSAIVCSILIVSEFIVLLLIGFVKISMFQNEDVLSISSIIAVRVFTLSVALLVNRFVKPLDKVERVPKTYLLAYIITLVSTSYLFFISLLLDGIEMIYVFISGIAFLAINTTLLFLDKKVAQHMNVLAEKQLLEQQNHAYENQNALILQSNERIRSLRHDMKNHLLVLKEMQTREGHEKIAEKYIGDLLEGIEGDLYAKSNNFVIDSIVNFKLSQLSGSDAQVSVDLQIPHILDISAYDLTTILGNLLDNALTALKKVEEKKLYLQISTRLGNLVIIMENTYNGQLILEKGKLRTTKAYVEGHGYGLDNVEKVVEKYGGDLQIDYTSDLFSAKVLLPYQESAL